MPIELRLVAYHEKSILQNLLELYEYDCSEFNGCDLNAYGLFGYRYLDHYWAEEGRSAFFIRCEGKLAGFALVRQLAPQCYSMPEFFIARKYRRQGIGREAAWQLFQRFPGQWHVSQEQENYNAQRFWKGVIHQYTEGIFQEETQETGPVLVFDSNLTLIGKGEIGISGRE